MSVVEFIFTKLTIDTTPALHNNSSLPSPLSANPKTLQKNSRGGNRKSNKSTRRSSLNQKKDSKKKAESTPPPQQPHHQQQQEQLVQQQQDPPPEDDANITRCICGEDNDEANDVIMFQCDKCSVWQHGPCVGLYAEFPGDYFCEKCRPDLHTTGFADLAPGFFFFFLELQRQYQKSSTHQPSRRSPSFTSSSSRRERVNPDAASLAAFLTDAGVKPEDQLSLGGFALPTFAQTRRQSNMLVDGAAVPLAQKKHLAIETSSSGTIDSALPSALPDFHKTKRKRPSLDLIESPTLPSAAETPLEDKLKRPRISPAAELPSPAASVSTTTSKLNNATNTSSHASGPTGKLKRILFLRALINLVCLVGTSKKGVFSSRNGVSVSSSMSGRRGSPTKRGKEEGRRTKQQQQHQQQVTEAQHLEAQQRQQQQAVEAVLSEGWGLPDHLSYLDYLLPTPLPQPLVIEQLTPDGPTIKCFETPSRVKFPSKRTTLADLRKRSKHLVDYLQKVQIESSDREKRNQLIANSISSSSKHHHNLPFSNNLHRPVVSNKTLDLIDDLSRQLYHWQEKFKQN
ncbi:hypothetical protein VP01_1946g11 [Puccinia sorghi]|uniref:Zinc finger PHD-type domain-containing protein n=1 Tax=Puccinia sorghi TaxID=27349 RepID=A0A0L6VCT0_9BASI|nr:hypothetical protein VP01_1946g11 [Puccinia sorghi]